MCSRLVTVVNWVLVGFMAVAAAGCKPRAGSTLRAAADADVDVRTIIEQLAEVNAILTVHTTGGVSLLEGLADAKQPLKNERPVPGSCNAEAWRNDPRWTVLAVNMLEGYALGSYDLRVRTGAIEALAILTTRYGLTCASEYVGSLLPKLKQSRRYCDTFGRCAVVSSLVGSLVQIIPDASELDTAMADLRRDVEANSGGLNTRHILEFRLSSYKTHLEFNRATRIYASDRDGDAILLDADAYKSLRGRFAALHKEAYEKLFVVNQMRDSLNISPVLVKQMIVNDMLDGVDFKSLEEPVQEMLLSEAIGLFDSAWQLQQYNSALVIYLDRLRAHDPRPWLAKVKKAAQQWSTTEDAFDFDGFSLTDSDDLLAWEGSVNPYVAFTALTQFVDREAKLPWRRPWSQTISAVYEAIPPEVRDMSIKATLYRGMRASMDHRQMVLASLGQRGLIQSVSEDQDATPEDIQRAEAANAMIKGMVEGLLDNEEAMASYFRGFSSVFGELMTLYERIGERVLHLQSVLQKLEAGSPSEADRDHMLDAMDENTSHVLAQWLKLRCMDVLYRWSEDSSTETGISEDFFLDPSMKLVFQCRPTTSGEAPNDLAMMAKRATLYASTFSYNRTVDRGLTKVKEAGAMAMLLVIGMPAGIGGKLAAQGARYLLVNAARAGLVQMLRKQLVRRLMVGTFGLFVNIQIFHAGIKINDKLWNAGLGIEVPNAPSESWGQYIFHTMQGMAVLTSLNYVSRFSNAVVQKISGRLTASSSRELSTYLQRYRTSLKPTWKQGVAAFGVGLTAETGLFFAIPYASEFLGTNVLRVYEELSPEERAFQKLYAPSWDETLKESFSIAVLFRTFGLLHSRGNLRETTEFQRFRESVRNSMSGTMSPEQAMQILGVPPNASRDAVATAHRRLVTRYHPDKVIPKAERAFRESLGTGDKQAVGTLLEAARKGTPFAEVTSTLKLSPEQAKAIEPAYAEVMNTTQMFKQVQQAFEVATKDS